MGPGARRGYQISWDVVKNICDQPDVDARNQTRVLGKTLNDLTSESPLQVPPLCFKDRVSPWLRAHQVGQSR